jgi:hypothetical protein
VACSWGKITKNVVTTLMMIDSQGLRYLFL